MRHAGLILRKAIARIRRKTVSIPSQPTVRLLNGSVNFEYMALSFLDEGDFRAMLTETYDIILCDFLKQNLSEGDIVLDVGANVGYISAMAASCVGPGGEVHGFEPLAECYERLERLRQLNPELHLYFNNIALGEAEGSLPIVFNPAGDSRNASLVPGKQSAVSREVPVRRLDDYIARTISSPERIKAIKIDVEGFEFPVLKGLSGFLKSFQPVIVCEIKPWEVARCGSSLSDFDSYMKGFGYSSCPITEPGSPVALTALTDMDVLVFRK